MFVTYANNLDKVFTLFTKLFPFRGLVSSYELRGSTSCAYLYTEQVKF